MTLATISGKSKQFIAIASVALIVLGLLLVSAAFASTSEAEQEPPFSVSSTTKLDDGGLLIELDVLEYGAEIVSQPVVQTEDGPVEARFGTRGEHLVLEFDDIGDRSGEIDVEFPAIAVRNEYTSSQSLKSATINGPEDHVYNITGHEIDRERELVEIKYQPSEADAPAINNASLDNGDTTEHLMGAGAHYSGEFEVKGGSLVFPLDAENLLDDEATEISVSEFKAIEGYVLTIGADS